MNLNFSTMQYVITTVIFTLLFLCWVLFCDCYTNPHARTYLCTKPYSINVVVCPYYKLIVALDVLDWTKSEFMSGFESEVKSVMVSIGYLFDSVINIVSISCAGY